MDRSLIVHGNLRLLWVLWRDAAFKLEWLPGDSFGSSACGTKCKACN
jgi:hypothetical protein